MTKNEYIGLLHDAYISGAMRQEPPSRPKSSSRLYIMEGVLHGAWKQGLSQSYFDFSGAADFLLALPSLIKDGDTAGQLYNPNNTKFNVIWKETEKTIELKPA